MLSDLGRRVLGHLPVWAADEDAHVAEEGGPGQSIRGYSLRDFTVRMQEDLSTTVPDGETGQQRPLVEDEVHQALQQLGGKGFAIEDGADWKMTQAGFDELHAPRPEQVQVPGAIQVDLNPGVITSGAVS